MVGARGDGPRIGIGSGRALKVLVCYILYYLLLHHMLHLQMQKVSLYNEKL